MAVMLETPSRVWRRIQDIEGQEMPSLPSLPPMDDSVDNYTETTDDLDISRETDPIHSTPAAFSSHTNTLSTIKQPLALSAASTARFANSLASRSSKSAMSASGSRSSASRPGASRPGASRPGASRPGAIHQPSHQQYSFDASMIPPLPQPRDDVDIRSSDQDTQSRDSSVGDTHLPPLDPTGLEDDLDLSDALQSVSRAGSPVEQYNPTPRKNYDYSVSLKSEPRPSQFDRLRNVSFRRPLSRNTRTPSLTRTNSPSPSSSTSHSTPQSAHSVQYAVSRPTSPIPALSVPLPRSATASPMPASRATSASPMPARLIPLPPSNTTSPVVGLAQRRGAHEPEEPTEHDFAPPSMSLPQADMTEFTEMQTEQSSLQRYSQEGREPTFSSEEDMTALPGSRNLGQDQQSQASLTAPSIASSSLAQSAMLTPTPAFQARPRARFHIPIAQSSTTPPDPVPGSETADAHEEDVDESTWRPEHPDDLAPATPNAHKRSFLLSVINSTARPRLKHLTPHPHRLGDISETPAAATPGPGPPTVLAGVTPAPRARPALRPRLSHPLAQAWTAQSQSDSGSESAGPAGDEAAGDRASFLSTTSSQDLTTHARANASFDPVMGLGDRGHGIGRFNAGKLNNYLHGLNRKLQEENELLVARLRALEEQQNLGAEGTSAVQGRRASAGRRVSAGPFGLGDVAEDAWVEEKAQMEDKMDELRLDVQKAKAETDEVLYALQEERAERTKDKERWRQRMGEVQAGVQEIVEDLDQKLADAEQRAQAAEKDKLQTVKEVERRLAEVVVERDVLAERVEQAEGALERSQDLGGEINAANERVSKVLSDLKNANIQIKELEDEVAHADERMDALEQELREEKKLVAELEDELQVKSDELSQTLQRLESLQDEGDSAQRLVEQHKAFALQMETEAKAAIARVTTLQQRLATSENKIEAVTAILDQEQEKSDALEAEAERVTELARELEEALDAAGQRIRADDEQINALKIKVSGLEREVDRSRSRMEASKTQAAPDEEMQAEVEALEIELDNAHREIARLTTVVSQSPSRKAIERAKDARITMLEQERDDLLERLKTLKNSTLNIGTPGRGLSSNMSPMHRHILNITMKSPRTPGGPLRDLSWLQTTMNDPSAAPFIAEIERLQGELERANESIDEKLDRLEDAGLGVVGLTKQLEDAREKIMSLEDEFGRLSRREERRLQRLEKLRCQKCLVKIDVRSVQRPSPDESSFIDPADISMASEPPTPPTKTTERLRADLKSVTDQLSGMKRQWEDERRKLLGENASLKDATNRLNAEVRQAKTDMRRLVDTERVKVGAQGELERAKLVIEELEEELKVERSRLRSLNTEQSKAERQKEEVVLQLRRTESDMAEIRDELQRIKHENHELEDELRTNANVEQKARLLENKVAENAETIEQLRRERSLLVADHKNLQTKLTQTSENVNKLRKQNASSQSTHDQRRHELDHYHLEIEDLRRALSTQADELHRAEQEKDRAAMEKGDLARTVSSLESDLRRVRRDAEAFGRDLRELRAQKEKLENDRKEEGAKAERAQKQAQTQIRVLKDEAKEQREKARAVQEEWDRHVCASSSSNTGDGQLVALKSKHKNECKGLIVQIKYLKAKWTRESTLRSDLGYQKQYLLVLLARSDRSEQKILAAIAKIGFLPPAAPSRGAPAPKRRTLKSVALSVIFTLRARHASDAWREQSSSKEAIAAALQDVRKAREERARQTT